MRYSVSSFAARAALVVVTALGAGSALATGPGFVALSFKGDAVMTYCNAKNLPDRKKCSVDSLPGEAGYTQVASRASNIVKNEVVIGSLLDRVWKHADGTYIFGAQIRLNANAYDLTGLPFSANDLFRQVLERQPVSIAYFKGSASKALVKAGRTVYGLNEEPPVDDDKAGARAVATRQPARENGWVDFRISAGAAESSTPSSAHSPWLLVKSRAPRGYSIQPFAFRLLSSDFADASEFVEIFLPGYQPN